MHDRRTIDAALELADQGMGASVIARRLVNTGRAWSSPRYSFKQLSRAIRSSIFCLGGDELGVHWTASGNTI
jgi:hypothetical protein